MKSALSFCCVLGLALAGCGLEPSAGPSTGQVAEQAVHHGRLRFDVIKVDRQVLATVLTQPRPRFASLFKPQAKPPRLPISVGDTISVVIWEAAAGGLFTPSPQEFAPGGAEPQTEPLANPPGLSIPSVPGGAPPSGETAPGIPSGGAPAGAPPGAEAVPGLPPGVEPGAPAQALGAAAAASAGQGIAIPEQAVGFDGGISIPYAGRIHVAGRSPEQVQRLIERRLAGEALEPQVLVTVSLSSANSVSVTGDAVHGARVPLSPGGERLLEVIAAAGGDVEEAGAPATAAAGTTAIGGTLATPGINGIVSPGLSSAPTAEVIAGPAGAIAAPAGGETAPAPASRIPVRDILVRLSRDGVTATIPLHTLVDDPAEDIYARPGDVLTLMRVPKTFSVFGGTGMNSMITFDSPHPTLSQALAMAGGLRDDRANPDGVFLFRYEPVALVKALRQPVARPTEDGAAPVVYRFDFRQADGFLLAQRFPLHDKDIIFVADASTRKSYVLAQTLGQIVGPIEQGLSVCKVAKC